MFQQVCWLCLRKLLRSPRIIRSNALQDVCERSRKSDHVVAAGQACVAPLNAGGEGPCDAAAVWKPGAADLRASSDDWIRELLDGASGGRR